MRLSAFAAVGILAASLGLAQTPAPAASRPVALYSAVGSELTHYALDVTTATLVKQETVTLLASVQEGWPHPSGRYLYITWSSGGPGEGGHEHGVSAFRVDPKTGALQAHGPSIALPARSVYMTLDIPGTHFITAHNEPAGATVYAINADGTIGAKVPQPANLDFGVYPHNVRMDASNQMVTIMARGNQPTATKAEEPGAMKIFGYKDGVLSNRASIAVNGGLAYRVRHLEFHPTRPFAFVTIEAQNKLHVYRKLDGPTLSAQPIFVKDVLVDPKKPFRQATSSIHMHPNGRFLYLGNRASDMVDFQGKKILTGGENSIAVFSVNQETGEPTLIQNADTHGNHPRTFAIDPSGRILVVGNSNEVLMRSPSGTGDQLLTIPASLSVFRIGDDGKLTFVRKYDQKVEGPKTLFWTGMVTLP